MTADCDCFDCYVVGPRFAIDCRGFSGGRKCAFSTRSPCGHRVHRLLSASTSIASSFSTHHGSTVLSAPDTVQIQLQLACLFSGRSTSIRYGVKSCRTANGRPKRKRPGGLFTSRVQTTECPVDSSHEQEQQSLSPTGCRRSEMPTSSQLWTRWASLFIYTLGLHPT